MTEVSKSTVVPPSVPSAFFTKRLVRTTVVFRVVPILVQPAGVVTVAYPWLVKMQRRRSPALTWAGMATAWLFAWTANEDGVSD